MRSPRRPSAPAVPPRPRTPRRERHGRGVRGEVAPREVPRSRSRGQRFDDLVLDAVEELEAHLPGELSGVEFAVEDVPTVNGDELAADVVADRGVPLGRLLRGGVPGLPAPTIVVYRRPVEARSVEVDERGELVFMVVAELVAELLGRDIDEIDPPRS